MTLAPVNDPAMMGSNFPRKELDFYPTPEWLTEIVVPHIHDMRPNLTNIWEPACGDGAMVKVLERPDIVAMKPSPWKVQASDINNYGFPGTIQHDFLSPVTYHVDAIVTNPPYGDLAEAFIRKALVSTRQRNGIVAMLLRHEYDTASGRVDLFEKEPFARHIVITKRPRWIPGSTGAPRHSYGWYIWDWEHQGPAEKYYWSNT